MDGVWDLQSPILDDTWSDQMFHVVQALRIPFTGESCSQAVIICCGLGCREKGERWEKGGRGRARRTQDGFPRLGALSGTTKPTKAR